MRKLPVTLIPLVVILLSSGNAFSVDPTEEWVARYNGPGNSADIAIDLAVGETGEVYVTGYCPDSLTSDYDYHTIGYDIFGTVRWMASYDYQGYHDYAECVAVDGDGNVIVAGGCESAATDFDYVIVKYDSDGVEEWVASYNGPVDGRDTVDDIAVDADGNIYVTGNSHSGVEPSITYDYATVKYDSDGVEQWVARYDGPDPNYSLDRARAIAVDANGNVFVTGDSHGIDGDTDFTTVMYDSNGVEQWVVRYDYGTDDLAQGIALDGEGNCFVLGNSMGSSKDLVLVKYGLDGTELWTNRYDGPGNGDDSAALWGGVAADANGNVYIAGISYISDIDDDYVTIKYNSDGVQQWVRLHSGPGWSGSSEDRAFVIALDAAGNVYVTGSSIDLDTYWDFDTVKYDGAGVEQWSMRYSGPGNDVDDAVGLAIDGAGNVFVAGYSMGDGTSLDYATIMYSQLGVGTAHSEELGIGAFNLHPAVPNPCYDALTLRYSAPEASEATLEIFDLTGKRISGVTCATPGTGLWNVSVDEFPPGVYFCQLRSGAICLTEKFIVLH